MNRKIKRIEVPLAIKAASDTHVEGYGSVFGNVDAYDEVVAPGAFTRSLGEHAEKGTAPAMLWSHNPDWPVGRWAELSEDDRGLVVRGEFADTALGRDTRTLVKMGAITGMSIGFVTRKAVTDEESGIRTLTDVDLWEVSLVTFPANKEARVVEARAAELAEMSINEIEGALRDAGLSRREAKTVVSRLMSLGSQRDAAAIRDAAETVAGLKALRAVLCRS